MRNGKAPVAICALVAFSLIAAACGDASAQGEGDPTLDLDTLEADTAAGTVHAQRAEDSYVGLIDDGQAIGIAPLNDVGAETDSDDEIVAYLYDRNDLAVMTGHLNTNGEATLASDDEFTANAATGDAGVYWAHGSDENPDVSCDWVVLADGSQWGCVCRPPATSPCCHLDRL